MINWIRDTDNKELIDEISKVDKFAAKQIPRIFDNSEIYPPYVWNKALARAARHVLNDQGACGLTGDIYSMGYSQVLSAYYAWNYLGLEF